MSKLVMGYWDCPFCGTKGNRGDVVNCPSCGRARGDVQFYVKDYEEGQNLREDELDQYEQLDEEKAQSFSKNPDWYCSFCNSLNSDNAEFCGNCGSSRADSEANYFEMLKKKKEREAAETAAQPQPRPASEQPKSSRKTFFIIACIVLAIIGLFVWMNGSNTSGDLKVTSLGWIRNINIEENRMYSESGWSLPDGAEQTGAQREIHHYEQVFDHYENVEVPRTRQVYDHDEYTLVDNGNGTFSQVAHPVYRTETYYETEQRAVTRSEPRYATKYYYNIWRWTPSRDVTASGEDHETAWPEVTLAENEREGRKTEKYYFTVENQKKAGETAVYSLAESEWMKISVDEQVFITAKRSGADPYLSDEKGNRIADLVRER